MNDGLIIRLADLRRADDQDAVRTLINAYAADSMGLGRPLPPEIQSRLVRDLAGNSSALQFIARQHGSAAGIAVCFRAYSTFRAQPLVNIHDLYVREEHRRRGIAARLLDAAESYAAGIGCCKLTLEVRHDNLIAQSLYRRKGFSPGTPPYGFWQKEPSGD
jgi:ribosomal protein S18 acetylase RimI-like enzyme